jgi:hypothetical protein
MRIRVSDPHAEKLMLLDHAHDLVMSCHGRLTLRTKE